MPKTRIPSPSRSHAGTTTPRRHKHRGSRSVSSNAPSNASGRLTAIIDQFKEQNMDSFRMSPMNTRWSVLTDNTDIEEPRRKSWWKNLNENSQDLMLALEDDKATDSNNSVEDISDLEILSQENKNYSLDLPESSDSESIHSIVITQRKLFTQKENKSQKRFGQLVGTRETLTKLHKTNTTFHEKTIAAGTKDLFQGTKRSKPVFSAALLNISPNKTAVDKTIGNITAESRTQVKNIFGNRPAKKRKNIFADFILSDNEPETSEVHPHAKKGTVKKIQSANEEQEQVGSKVNIEKSKKVNPKQIVNKKIDDGNKYEDQRLNGHQEEHAQANENLEVNQHDSSETLDKLHEPNNTHDEEIVTTSTKNLFQGTKRSKPVLSTALLNISVDKTVTDKTSVNVSNEPKIPVKNIFGKRPDKKRKNIFADFVVSYSEHETSDIQTQVKKSQNANETTRPRRADLTNENKKVDTEQSEKVNVEDRANPKEDDDNEMENEQINECQEVYSEATENFKSHQPQKKIRKLVDSREAMDQLHKTNISTEDDIVTAGTKTLFQGTKRSNIVFSSTLLHISPNKTITDKAEGNVLDPKILVKNIFGNRSAIERKNIFADFLESESEHEISEIQAQEKEDSITPVVQDTNEDHENEANGIKEIGAVQSVEGNQGDDVEPVEEEANESEEDEEMNIEPVSSKLDNRKDVVSEEEVENDIESEREAINNEEITVLEKECDESKKEIEIGERSDCDISDKVVNEIDEEEGNESKADEEMNYEESDEEIQEKVRSHEDCIENEEIHEQSGEGNQEKISSENEEEDGNDSENDDEMNYEECDEEIHGVNRSQEKECIENEQMNEHQKVHDEVNQLNKEEGEEMNKHPEEHDEANELNKNEGNEIDNDGESEEEECIEDNNDDDMNETDVHDEVNELSEEEEGDESENVEEMNYDESDEEILEVNRSEEEECNENEQAEEIRENQNVNDDVNESNEEEQDNASENYEEMKYEESDEEILEVSRSQEEGIENEKSEETNENQEVHDEVSDSNEEEQGNESENDEESDDEILENNKSREKKCMENKENEQMKENQDVNKFNEFKEVTPPVDSSAEGSGWDSHRTTRKTLRQTFGKDFTPRKSLRALVMEKSAKQTANMQALHSETVMFPQANSTEFPEHSNAECNVTVESDHELSKRTRLTTLETYLQKMKQQNIEKMSKMDQAIRNSLCKKVPSTQDTMNLFKVPLKPPPRKLKPISSKPKKQIKSIFLGELPSEVVEDMKYKPPKRFQPASWITKRLYKYLEDKLELKYDYKARVRAEKLVETIYHFAKDLRRHKVAPIDSVDVLKHELARLEIVKTHFEFYEFFHEFMPREIRIKVVPDVVNKIPLPRHGVFADILKANAVQ